MTRPQSDSDAGVTPAAPTPARRSIGLRRSSVARCLEPRLMFDGAGMVTAVDAGEASAPPPPPPTDDLASGPESESEQSAGTSPQIESDTALESEISATDDEPFDTDDAASEGVTDEIEDPSVESISDATTGDEAYVAYPAAGGASAELTNGIQINDDGGNDAYLEATSGIVSDLDAVTYEILFSENHARPEVPLVSYNFGTNDEFAIQTIDDGRLEMDVNTSVIYSNIVDYNAVLRDGEVHAFAFTWDNTSGDWNVYVDGARVDSGTGFATGAVIRSGGTLQIGQEQDTFRPIPHDPDQVFTGTIHDVRLWSVARTASEILENDQHILEAPVPGLIANWQMSELAGGDTVVDLVNPGANDLVVGHTVATGFSPGEVTADLSIDENITNGTIVGSVVPTAPHVSGGDVSYQFTLTGDPSGAFEIDSTTGVISVANASRIDFEQNVEHHLSIHVEGSDGSQIDDVVRVFVDDIDEPLTHRVPDTQSLPQGDTLVFSTESGNSLAIDDQGPTDNLLRVSLAVGNGTVYLGSTQGIDIISGVDGSAAVRIQGLESEINAALNGLRYQSRDGFSGVDWLYISSVDMTNGETAQSSVSVQVNAPATGPIESTNPPVAPEITDTPTVPPTAPVVENLSRSAPSVNSIDDVIGLRLQEFFEIPISEDDDLVTSDRVDFVEEDAQLINGKAIHKNVSTGKSIPGIPGVDAALVPPQISSEAIEAQVQEELAEAPVGSFGPAIISTASVFPSLALSTALFDVLDEMQSQMVLDGYTEVEVRLFVGTVSLTLSVGYLLWILKGSMLMGGVFSVNNLARNLDPMALIADRKTRRKTNRQDDETVESIFDNVQPA